jgi:hypothetical protein
MMCEVSVSLRFKTTEVGHPFMMVTPPPLCPGRDNGEIAHEDRCHHYLPKLVRWHVDQWGTRLFHKLRMVAAIASKWRPDRQS